MQKTITCQIPDLDKFVVRATMPVKKGHEHAVDLCPFSIIDPFGKKLDTQWSVVSRYPNGQAAVVKVAAVVARGDMPVGSDQVFEVIEDEHANTVPDLDADFMQQAYQVYLRAFDMDGNEYRQPLVIKPEDFSQYSGEVLEIGPAYIVAKSASVLAPVQEGTPFPYLGGVQNWTTVRADGNGVVSIDLKWHNALATNAISHIYFDKLELVMPDGWNCLDEQPNPEMGAAYTENGMTVIPIVMSRSDGTAHMLPQRFERVWRLHLYAPGEEKSANEYALQGGWGVSNQWDKIPNYYSQFGFVPYIDQFVCVQSIASELSKQLQQLGGKLNWFNQPQDLGFFSPANSPYGGPSGGVDIKQWDGIIALNSKKPIGLMLHRVLHRRYIDRFRTGLYAYSGDPIKLDDFLNEDGSTPWQIFNAVFKRKSWPNNDEFEDAPFEFDEVDTSYIDSIKAQGRAPVYEDDLLAYEAILHTHEVRTMKDAKALIWLDNDHLSKSHFAMRAEIDRMCYYEGEEGRLANLLDYADMHVGLGGSFNRGNAWVTDTIVTYYAISDDSERARYYPWLEATKEILSLMQMPNGHIQREFQYKVVTAPPFDGKYSMSQPFEHCFVVHAVRALLESVYRGVDPESATALEKFLYLAIVGTYTFAWKWKPDGSGPDGPGPWFRIAVGSLDPESAVISSHFQHPVEQFEEEVNNYHVGNILGYGLDIFGDNPMFKAAIMNVISLYVNGKPPLQGVMDNGLTKIDSEAMLLALLQQN